QRTAAAGEHRAGLLPRHMIANRRVIGDAFIDDDRVEPDLTAHASSQIFRRDDLSARRLETSELDGSFAMPLRVVTTAALSGSLVDCGAIESGVQLGEGGRRVGPITLPRLDVPERRRLLQRVDVDDGD